MYHDKEEISVLYDTYKAVDLVSSGAIFPHPLTELQPSGSLLALKSAFRSSLVSPNATSDSKRRAMLLRSDAQQ